MPCHLRDNCSQCLDGFGGCVWCHSSQVTWPWPFELSHIGFFRPKQHKICGFLCSRNVFLSWCTPRSTSLVCAGNGQTRNRFLSQTVCLRPASLVRCILIARPASSILAADGVMMLTILSLAFALLEISLNLTLKVPCTAFRPQIPVPV